MKVNWKNPQKESPIFYSKSTAWNGFEIRHVRVASGELVEQTYQAHEVNITLDGSITTEKHAPTGSWRRGRNEAGNVCLTPAGQPMRAAWDGELECLMINLEPSLVAQIAFEQNLSGVELIETDGQSDLLIQHVGLALLAEADSKEPFGRLYAESLANTLVLHLLKKYSTVSLQSENTNSGGLPGYKLRRAKEFIDSHLEEDFTLADVAGAVGLSQFHFARAFRRSTGKTVQQFVTQQRVAHAKELLTTGDLPIVEISVRTGFKSQSHFTTLFRKLTAYTPKEWRAAKHR